ncbi:MAG: fatty acid desaturase [Sorangiineae bacterium NIC37A_2]|jgi:beta-carotene hydroxylase|nr:MAG: fatty acid desaturase [Sorangiineae bacterium NIC37A_2]
MLRYRADIRTLLWMLVFAPGLVALQYARPDLLPYLSWLSFYFAISASTIAHNHQHCPTFENKTLNTLFSYWISIIYGFPTFAWIPTHNLNHHKYVNKPGDATITWRFTNSHNYLVAASYFFVSSYYQSGPIKEFLAQTKEKNPERYWVYVSQYVVVIGAHLGLAALAVSLHGVGLGLTVYAFTLLFPAIVSLWTVMTFNYDQHVHTDPWSRYNHSRNFVSPVLNFLLFNNGYHTVHHENAARHWSLAKEEHEKIKHLIDPSLNQKSMWLYWFKQYVLAPFFPSLGTKQIGRAPWDTGEGKLDLTTAPVGFGDTGTNVARV